MTTRNLNTTYRDILIKQYRTDHLANSPFPIRYLLHHPTFKKDLWWEVSDVISPDEFKRAVLKCHLETRGRDVEGLTWEGGGVKVRVRVSPVFGATGQVAQGRVGMNVTEGEEEEEISNVVESDVMADPGVKGGDNEGTRIASQCMPGLHPDSHAATS
jgi:hypothetical protein